LTPEQKQLILQRLKAIILAALDYLLQQSGGSFVCDESDYVAEYYQQQKLQIEKYYKQRRLDRLQQRFESLSKGLQMRADLNFSKYIKKETGYDIDIFEDLRKRIDIIIAQDEIRDHRDLRDVSTMINYYREMKDEGEEVEKLNDLHTDYVTVKNKFSGKRKGEYTEVVSSVEKDGMVKVTGSSSTGPKPKHFEEQEVISPDGKRYLRATQWSTRMNASTYVTVHFPTASGSVYAANGICKDVKAWWKNNSTIVIETKNEYEAISQSKKVRSFNDVITIEYIEH
jgi:hypothetical protein